LLLLLHEVQVVVTKIQVRVFVLVLCLETLALTLCLKYFLTTAAEHGLPDTASQL